MSKKQWEDEILKPTLKRYPERKEALLDNRERLNVPEDVKNTENEFPGSFPYTRGIHPTGYRGKRNRPFGNFKTDALQRWLRYI